MRALAFVLVLALSLPARAVDCSQQPDPVAGQPITESQLECIRVAIVNLRKESADREALRVEAAVGLAACEATSAIACPPAPLPIIPVILAGSLALIVGFVAGVLAFR